MNLGGGIGLLQRQQRSFAVGLADVETVWD